MAELKRITPQKLLWVDLEFTGLDPRKNKIIEVAAMVTDWDFNVLATYESVVRQTPAVLEAADPIAKQINQASGLWPKIAKGLPEGEVEDALCQLVKQHFGDGPALLAGNTIHMDRQFIRSWWPKLEKLLHYRMLDVSAWKVVMIGKYGKEFEKQETHRALDDIRESIDELKFYLKEAKLK